MFGAVYMEHPAFIIITAIITVPLLRLSFMAAFDIDNDTAIPVFASGAIAGLAIYVAETVIATGAFPFADTTFIVVAIIVFTFSVLFTFAIYEDNIKFRFCIYVFVAEAFTLLCAMTIWLPYLALIIAILAITVAMLLGESKLRLWADNPPPEIVFREYRRMVGVKYPYGVAEVLEQGEPIPDPWRIRLHRRLHNIYA